MAKTVALVVFVFLSAGVLLAESTPEQVTPQPIPTLTSNVWLADSDPLCRALVGEASKRRDVKGVRCRLIGFCVKTRPSERLAPRVIHEAIAGLWFQDGAVALYTLHREIPGVPGDAAGPWEQGYRFTPECRPGRPEYVRAEDLERDRTLIGKFVRTTTFGHFGLDSVLSMALDREWLGETVGSEMLAGLSTAEMKKREAILSPEISDPSLFWEPSLPGDD